MGRVANILHNASFNPNYDLVWSFKFLLSAPGTSYSNQGGFVTYLTTASSTYTIGASGSSLGYDGPPERGVIGGALGIGFDTMGIFATSGIDSRPYGTNISRAKPNSLTIRGGYSAFDVQYTESLSALNTGFTLLTSTEDYQWLRFRLGNIGRTLYIDYRRNDNDPYSKLAEVPVTLPITDFTFYKVGVSFAYPLSSTVYSNQSNTIFRIKNFQVEGSPTIPDTFVYSTSSMAISALEFETGTPAMTGNRILADEDEHIFLT